MFAVTLAAGLLLASPWLGAQDLLTQYGHKPPSDKGPRAVGLVQLSPNGKKARFIPIAIMLDGKFYDAGAYKADPVPMALDFGVVYEGFRTGVSQGTFTITQPGQLNKVWIAEGTWLPAGAIDPRKPKKYAPPVIEDDDKGGQPVLHRRVPKTDSDSSSDNKDKETDKNKDQQKPAAATPATQPTADQQKPATGSASPSAAPSARAPSAPETAKTSKPPETAKASAPASSPTSASESDEPIEDPNRPRLRRGKPDPNAHHEPFTTFEALEPMPSASAATSAGAAKSPAAKASAAAAPPIVIIPAISDAHGPDPRPYAYDVKPAEEAIYRTKMLELAATQLRAEASAAAKAATPASKTLSAGKPTRKSAHKSAAKLPAPVFDDVSLRIFDLSNSNEPVLVLSAKAHPPGAGATEGVEQPKEITLIARTSLEGELQKLFFSQTDLRHLDETPRMELIDAVDADGDGRGELLFRRTFDDGSAYAIYRVTADGLWPLFEGTP